MDTEFWFWYCVVFSVVGFLAWIWVIYLLRVEKTLDNLIEKLEEKKEKKKEEKNESRRI